jgi:hypothetical protein
MFFATGLRERYGRLPSLRIRSFGNCEFDEDLVWVDLRPDNMFVNEGCVCDLGGFVEVAAANAKTPPAAVLPPITAEMQAAQWAEEDRRYEERRQKRLQRAKLRGAGS